MTDVKGSTLERMLARQKKVLGYIEQGLTQSTMAQLEGVSEKTIERDVRAVLDEYKKGMEAQKDNYVAEAVSQWRKKKEFLEVDIANLKAQRKALVDAAKQSGLPSPNTSSLDERIYRLIDRVQKMDLDMRRFLQTTGHIPVAPTEVKNVLETGKQFVVRWARPDEVKKKGDEKDG